MFRAMGVFLPHPPLFLPSIHSMTVLYMFLTPCLHPEWTQIQNQRKVGGPVDAGLQNVADRVCFRLAAGTQNLRGIGRCTAWTLQSPHPLPLLCEI